jgi:hypothetical protein
MRRKPDIAESGDARTFRLAWWASFLATLALIAALGIARSAQALTLPPTGTGGTAFAISPPSGESESEEEEFESEEEEFEAEECEVGEEEECEEEVEEEGAEAPRECVLSSASATVSASRASGKVRLAVHYTAYSTGTVEVVYWLRGAKGPLSLGGDRAHFGRKGLIRETEALTEAQMSKAMAARNFTVELRPAHAPRYCNHLLDRHLTVRRAVPDGLTWSDPESSFRSSQRP